MTSGTRGFEFVWQETGGPTVTAPTKKGFGSRLANQIVASYFSGVGQTTYLPEGVRFELKGSYQTEADLMAYDVTGKSSETKPFLGPTAADS